jgi:hypothetical protein
LINRTGYLQSTHTALSFCSIFDLCPPIQYSHVLLPNPICCHCPVKSNILSSCCSIFYLYRVQHFAVFWYNILLSSCPIFCRPPFCPLYVRHSAVPLSNILSSSCPVFCSPSIVSQNFAVFSYNILPSSCSIFCSPPVRYCNVILFNILPASCWLFCNHPVQYSAVFTTKILPSYCPIFCRPLTVFTGFKWCKY